MENPQGTRDITIIRNEKGNTISGWLQVKFNRDQVGSHGRWQRKYVVIEGVTFSMYNTCNYRNTSPDRGKYAVFGVTELQDAPNGFVINTQLETINVTAADADGFIKWVQAFCSAGNCDIQCKSSYSAEADVSRDDYKTPKECLSSDDPSSLLPIAGTSVGIPEEIQKKTREVVDRLVKENNLLEPDRGDLEDKSIEWRQGKPDYTYANLLYFLGKTRNHAAGSLELIVENMVKRWEMEASHLINYDQWTTIQHDEYRVQANGGKVFPGREAMQLGNYNWLMSACPKELYDAEKETFHSSHRIFRTAFPGGFPWEVMEVYSGPPKVGFQWRHWANFTGMYKGNQGTGELVEMIGFGLITLSDMKVTNIEIFYKPNEFLEALQRKKTETNTEDYVQFGRVDKASLEVKSASEAEEKEQSKAEQVGMDSMKLSGCPVRSAQMKDSIA